MGYRMGASALCESGDVAGYMTAYLYFARRDQTAMLGRCEKQHDGRNAGHHARYVCSDKIPRWREGLKHCHYFQRQIRHNYVVGYGGNGSAVV